MNEKKKDDNADIKFHVGLNTDSPKEIMRFDPNGDIYVKGKLVKNDLEVVEGIRTFLIESGAIKPNGGQKNA